MSEPCKRCECSKPEPAAVDSATVECVACKGWFAVTVDSPEALEAFAQRFAP